MVRTHLMVFVVFVAIVLLALALFRPWQSQQRLALLEQAHAVPLAPPEAPLRVFHLGHSLVGRDMPVMLDQMAGPGHSHASQLGWGTSLREHWEPDLEINGFDVENAHDNFQPAHDAIGSGQYDAVILTEMVELRDAIKYHDSPKYKAFWAELARRASPQTRVYLYETWHNLDDPDGFLNRLDRDYGALWRGKILAADIAASGPDRATRVIPAGQVMAEFIRRIDAAGGVGNVPDRTALFGRHADGTQDTIHLSDLGNYLVAMTHFAVLYKRKPENMPAELLRADGSAAMAPTPDVLELMQDTVWDVVRAVPETGVQT